MSKLQPKGLNDNDVSALEKVINWVRKDPRHRTAEISVQFRRYSTDKSLVMTYSVGLHNSRGAAKFRLRHINEDLEEACLDAIKGNGRDGRIV